ncbi:MFS transporter [Frondihabitans australicus]|uniref:EmrB/QacA subfamily drug resistance transporter n=1 Tax=Frondihabitans australicus TaxID=386892 RepID=A0A495IMJ0_9MICO|nr:MFS transporter [Frondihabitans australicus]RKR76658.1 EmrB/QacA subfamily drug resistance transporter [Frondihabitans australicus]
MTLASATGPARTLPSRYTHRYGILAICCMSLFIASMDATVVNVALPSIGRELHSTISGLQWTIDGYTLVIASFLMLSGSTADKFGRRRVFQIGLTVFVIGSLLCSLAPSVPILVACRMLQAIGGSMLNPVALSIISATFTDGAQRARAVGVWGAVVGISTGFGPLIGGALTDSVGWRAIFWINIPIGIAAIVLTFAFVPESKGGRARKFDPVGQALVIVLLASVVSALIEGPRFGWASGVTIGLFVVAALALVALWRYEGSRDDPLLDFRFFTSIPFSSAILTAVCAFATLGGFLFLTALYLQEVRGFSPFVAGLCTLPLGLGQLVCAPLAGRLVSVTGTRRPLVLGSSGLAVGAILLLLTGATTPIPFLLVIYALIGCGLGLINPPLTNTAVSGMPRSRSGSAAGVASTARQTGVSLGVALAGTITRVSGATSVGAGFTQSTTAMWWVMLGFALVILALAFWSNSAAATRSTQRIQALLTDGTGAVRAQRP